MSIIRKVRSVERLFDHLGVEINSLQSKTGIHCQTGCGRCCNKPDIEATPLEFLPLAFHLFLERRAHSTLELLTNSESICTLYSPLSAENITFGSCSDYTHRGLICRLFGFGANHDKYGQLRLITCRIIKENQTDGYEKTMELLKRHEYVPVFSDYYKRLLQIDFRWGSQFLPINKAISEAIRIVIHHYAYRPFPRRKRAA